MCHASMEEKTRRSAGERRAKSNKKKGGAFRLSLWLFSQRPSRLDLALRRGLDELATAVQNGTRLLITQTEGFLDLGTSDRTLFSHELGDLVSEFSVGDLCLARLVGLVTLPLVKQFEFVSAETYDFRIVGAYAHNLCQHFSLSHNHHLLPFLHS